jgi:hypothetical protein
MPPVPHAKIEDLVAALAKADATAASVINEPLGGLSFLDRRPECHHDPLARVAAQANPKRQISQAARR